MESFCILLKYKNAFEINKTVLLPLQVGWLVAEIPVPPVQGNLFVAEFSYRLTSNVDRLSVG